MQIHINTAKKLRKVIAISDNIKMSEIWYLNNKLAFE